MIATLFSTDVVYGGLLSTAIGGGTAAGQFSGSLLATPGGHMKWKLIFVTACLTGFVGGMAGAGQDQMIASALITMGSVSLGAIEALAIGVVTIVIEDQKEMGVASGVFGSLRSVGGVVASEFCNLDLLYALLIVWPSFHLRGDFEQQSYTEHSVRCRTCAAEGWPSQEFSGRASCSISFRQHKCNLRSAGCHGSHPRCRGYGAQRGLLRVFQDRLPCYYTVWNCCSHRCLLR